jgi:hypothetical protein
MAKVWPDCVPLQVSPTDAPFQKEPKSDKPGKAGTAPAADGGIFFGTAGALQGGATVVTANPAATATGATPRTAGNQGDLDVYVGRYDSQGAPLWLAHIGGSIGDFSGFLTTNTQGRPLVVSNNRQAWLAHPSTRRVHGACLACMFVYNCLLGSSTQEDDCMPPVMPPVLLTD